MRYGTFENVLTAVCNASGLEEKDIFKDSRSNLCQEMTARHCVRYFARMHTKMTLKDIAKEWKADHTTIIHSIAFVKDVISDFEKNGTRARDMRLVMGLKQTLHIQSLHVLRDRNIELDKKKAVSRYHLHLIDKNNDSRKEQHRRIEDGMARRKQA